MASTGSSARADVLAFAAEFGHIPSVREAVAFCEAGRLPWEAVAELFRKSLAAGLASL